ncbi:MAG TPA: hypothetical protein VH092_20195, partial [Urbifossiella sp.]|nr:hypothetical protein [Urbifossiella sp.]
MARTVQDALAARDMSRDGCFVSCRACARLAEAGLAVLPGIEAAIHADVAGCYSLPADALERRFPGLLSLLVTYFAIGKDARDDRIVGFFDRLCGSVRVVAMRAVNVAWLLRTPTAPLPVPTL